MREDVKYVIAQLPAFEKLSHNEVSIRLEDARHHLLCADAVFVLFGFASLGNPATIAECLACCMTLKRELSKAMVKYYRHKDLCDVTKVLDRLGKASEALMISPELWLCVTLA